jgi:hypothetical protein
MPRSILRFLSVALTLTVSPISGVAAGVAIDDIELVILESESRGGMLGATFAFHSHVLLKNGEVYRNVNEALEDLDIDALKSAPSNDWGTWRRDGESYVFALASGKEFRLKKGWYWPVHPGEEGDDLAGLTYSIQSGHTNTAQRTTVAAQRDIHFLDGYRYGSGNFASVGSPGVVAKTEREPEATGSYIISGYTIAFKPDEGEPYRELFFYGDNKGAKDLGLICIGGAQYLLKE